MLLRRASVALVGLLVGPLGCAKSDPIGGSGGSSGEGGWGGWDDDGIADEAGPETGAGAGFSTASGEDGDPVEGGGGPGEGGSSATGCGDGVCSQPGESCETCEADCGACGAVCGDGACQAADGEDCESCAADCGACPECGDGVCSEPVEDCDVCWEDCGICACEPDDLEPNGSSPSATPLALNAERADLSICSTDVDWFSFTLSGTRTVTVRFNQGEGDLDLEIYDPLYVTGSYSHDDDEQVVLSGLPSGTYWARVYGYQGDTNPDYSIVVTD